MNLPYNYKERVKTELFKRRNLFGGTDGQYAKRFGLSAAIYSRLKHGEMEGIISDSQWLQVGRELDINLIKDSWKVVRTKVYENLEGSLLFCQAYHTSMVLIDDCGIGKTFCAKHIAKIYPNIFYIDCSQAKNKQAFIKLFAKTLGIDHKGSYQTIKDNVKYYLNQMHKIVIVLDECGDLEYPAFMELKELWNATPGRVGWYMMGADGLKKKIIQGITNEKVGYAEIFSRFADEFVRFTPKAPEDKKNFRYELLTLVAKANHNGKISTDSLVKQCMNKDATLRHLETLIKMHNNKI